MKFLSISADFFPFFPYHPRIGICEISGKRNVFLYTSHLDSASVRLKNFVNVPFTVNIIDKISTFSLTRFGAGDTIMLGKYCICVLHCMSALHIFYINALQKEGVDMSPKRQSGTSESEKTYRIVSDYILRNIAGEYVIVPTGENAVICNSVMIPNQTAAFFWKAFQTPKTIEDVTKAGMEQFEVDIETIRAAVTRFVSEGLEYQFIKEEIK